MQAAWHAAVTSLLEHKSRSVLSATGVMVGATAIVLLVSIALGVRQDITREVEGLGVNLIVVLPFRVAEGSMFAPNVAGVSQLTNRHVDLVRDVKGVRLVSPIMFLGGTISHGQKQSPTTFVIASAPEWFKIRPVRLAEGRAFSHNDDDSPVVVIGSIARKALFGNGKAVGQMVTINGVEYTVIGVTHDKSSEQSLFSLGSFENVAHVPYRFASTHVENPQVHRIMAQVTSDREPEQLVQELDTVLGASLPRDGYSVVTQEDLLKLVYKFMSILTYLLVGLTSIALFVGGVGIMTTTLMSVQQRAREIGVRKAVGARNADIFQHFLCEAAMIATVGGLMGLAVSGTASAILRATTPIKPLVTPQVIVLCVSVCLIVGIVFGLIPSMRAARNDPVASLRAE